jgi:signal transduction histidine kinase/ligand-binding sensor domain-containing protein/DNA-binding response OmpR family regulator
MGYRLQRVGIGLIVFIYITFHTVSLCGQSTNFNFKHLTTREGLSSNEVRAVFEDSNGFMWFATSDGLNRWDGYKFNVYKNYNNDQNSLSNNFLLCLAEDDKKNIWIGTNHGGLVKYSTIEDKFYRYAIIPDEGKTMPGLVVRCIYIDPNKNIWIGTHIGLAKYDPEKNSFKRFTFPDNILQSTPDIRSILQLNKDELIIQSDHGFFKLDLSNEVIQRIDFNFPDLDKQLFAQNNPTCFDSKGYLWIGSKTGLFKLEIKTGKYKKYQSNNSDLKSIRSNDYSVIFEDSRKNIWIGTENRGVYLYNPKTDEFTLFTTGFSKKNTISNNIISNIYEDHNSNVWFTTLEGGVSYFSYNNNQFEYYVHDPLDNTSINHNKIGAFYEDNEGSIWIGTGDGGLNKFIASKGQFERHQLKTNYIAPSIMAIETIDENSLYLSGLRIGLYQFDKKRGTFSNLMKNSHDHYLQAVHHITDISIDSKGNVWIVTHGKEGIMVYDPKSETFYTAEMPGNFSKELLSIPYAISIFEDSKNRLWVATYLGLYLYDNTLKSFLSINNDSTTLSSNYLYTLVEDSKKNIWIGSSMGLDRVVEKNGTITFERFREKYSLPSNVKGILEDNAGNLWISTNQGISKFNPDTKVTRDFKIINKHDNIELLERVCFKTSKGDMFFGGTNGFVKFNPNDLNELSTPSKVYIVDLQLFNSSLKVDENSTLKKSIIYTDEIKLTYKQSVLTLEYAALNYSNNGTTEYAYIMEGFDENWNFVGEKRFATYTNLSPGEYTFRVTTAVGNHLTDNEGRSVRLIINPPFWKTPFAYIFYVIVLVGILYLFRRSIINREKLKNELLLEKNEINSIQEASMMKLRFFTNISHEFRTPLTLIKAPIEKLIAAKQQLPWHEQQTIFNLIKNNSDKLLRMVNQLLDYRKLEAGSLVLESSEGDIVDFCKKTWSIFNILSDQKKINYIFQTSVDSQIMSFDADKMDRIITNLLSNAFKYTPEGGQIILKIEKAIEPKFDEKDSGEYIVITVSDTGIGIPENDVNQVFDRFYTVSRKGFEKIEGTGIGLTLVKELTELHKGQIAVRSKEKVGSEFEIKIPISVQSTLLNEPEKREQPLTTIEKITFSNEDIDRIIDGKPLQGKHVSGKRNILIVDDDNDIRQFLIGELSEEYDVIEAKNGNAGLEMAFNFNPDLILSDIMMPHMDGVEFCKRIKTDERTSHIPVILLTSLHSQEKQIEGLSLGADDYIFKPFNILILKSRISNLLNTRLELSQRFKNSTSLEFDNDSVNETDRKLIQSIIDIVLKNIANEKINADFISKKVLISRSVIYIKVEALTGQTVYEFIRNIRLKKSTSLLKQKEINITEVAYAVGFSSQSYFTRCFTKKFGKSPKDYAQEHYK